MANDKIDFVLDLDSQAFAQKIGDSVDSVRNLQDTLGKVSVAAGVVGAAFLAMKTAFSLAAEAEELKSLEVQFESLARQAGVSGEAILAGMQKASGGLIDTSDSIALANRAIIQLGGSADRIPEIMDVARKASVVFGGSIEDAFERISQAIATGQTRSLKQLGVIIDSDKAYRDFAASIGTTVGALNEQGRAQAILQAALPQLQERTKGIDTDVRGMTDAWTRFVIALKDIRETIAQTFGPAAGSALKEYLTSMKDGLDGIAFLIKERFGDGEERAMFLRNRIGEINNEIAEMDRVSKSGTLFEKLFSREPVERLAELREELKGLEAEALAISSKAKMGAPGEVMGPQPLASSPSRSFAGSRVEDERKFTTEINTLRQQELDARVQMEMTAADVAANMANQKVELERQMAARIAEIKANSNLLGGEKEALIEQTRENSELRVAALEQTKAQRLESANERYLRSSQNTADGVARAFEVGSARAQRAQADFGAVGARVFSSFSANANNAFVAFGAGQKSASEAAKGFLFGFLADEAFARGNIMFLSSLWPPNPAGLAGGAALMAFSGFLRSQAGGAGGGTAGAAVSTAGGGVSNSVEQRMDAPALTEERQRKSLQIVIQGSVFDSPQTGMRIAEMVREATDATDVRIT